MVLTTLFFLFVFTSSLSAHWQASAIAGRFEDSLNRWETANTDHSAGNTYDAEDEMHHAPTKGRLTARITAARKQFLAILSRENGCSTFFNAATARFNGSAKSSDLFGAVEIRLLWPPQRFTVGAKSTQGNPSAPIFVNPNGPFFVFIPATYTVGLFSVSTSDLVGPYPTGTINAEVTILAHEFAHTINAIPSDSAPLSGLGSGTNVGLSVANTNEILMYCSSAISKVH
jgi:hypothetical protein